MSHKIRKQRKVVRYKKTDINLLLQDAINKHQSGHLPEAKILYVKILRQSPKHAQALNLLGLIAQQTGDLNRAIKLGNQASTIEQNPRFLSNLGTAYRAAHDFEQAAKSFQRALDLDPALIEAKFNLASLCLDHGHNQKAISHFIELLAISPKMLEAHEGLGQVYINEGSFHKALINAENLLTLKPDHINAMFQKGQALYELGQLEEAKAVYFEILEISPQKALALNSLANILQRQKEFHNSIVYYQKAVRADPLFIEANINLAWSLSQIGKFQEAETCLKKIALERPEQLHIYSDYLFTLNYNPTISPADHLAAAKGWWDNYTKSPKNNSILNTAKIKSVKNIRLGFISPDFRNHAVTTFLLPLLPALKKVGIKVFCYAELAKTKEDSISEIIKKSTYKWRTIFGVNDDSVCKLIKEDKIDILIDLAGHSAYNRLSVMAQKPAAIQASWLGYVNTTGLPTIDFRITDDIADPAGSEKFYTEKLLYLPNGFFCYTPPTDSPEISELPALSTEQITFGSFNNLAKINPQVIEVWANILRRLPNSNLLIIASPFADPLIQEYFEQQFFEQGIEKSRLDLIPSMPMYDYLAFHSKVDIALDPFPHNGHTISCHTLWMGVPIIVLRGDRYAGRMGASLMTRIGLSNLIADNKEQYATIAIELAGSIAKLSKLRKGMRTRLSSSPICDNQQFAQEFRDVLQTMLTS